MASVRRRATKVALIVGTLFAIINYADRAMFGTLVISDVFKAIISYGVPYCVSTYSAVMAGRDCTARLMASEKAKPLPDHPNLRCQ